MANTETTSTTGTDTTTGGEATTTTGQPGSGAGTAASGTPTPETVKDAANGQNGAQPGDTDPETFPRDYVVNLRKESAGYREKAKRADDLAAKLHTALVTATGRLADATDLPFDDKHLDTPDALKAAIDDLLTRKPHLASRKPFGDIGQGNVGDGGGSVGLAGMLRANAG